jgi:chromosome segregation ATPase
MILLPIKEDFVMAACAREIEAETSMEERLARLEERTGYLQADVTDIKSRLERMEAKFEARLRRLAMDLRASFDARFGSATERFAAIDRRFDVVDSKFEAVDKRFDVVDSKFEAVDKRFDAVDKKFEAVDKKFDAVDKKFDAVDRRFEGVDRKLESLDNKLTAFRDEIVGALNKINVGRALDKVWALLAMAALLGVMARGFKWI